MTLIPIVLINVTTLRYGQNVIKKEVVSDLHDMSSVIKTRIEEIRERNNETLLGITSRNILKRTFNDYLRTENTTDHNSILGTITDAKNTIASIKRISVLDLEGNVRVSTDQGEYAENYKEKAYFKDAKLATQLDEYFLDSDGELSIRLAGPLVFNNQLVGIAIVDKDVKNLLKVVNDYSGLGQTGEIILAKKISATEAMIITPTRFDIDAPFKIITADATPQDLMLNAIDGTEEILLDVIDANGKEVIAATGFIETNHYGIVVKINSEEAFASINDVQNLSFALTVSSLVIIFFIAVAIARSITRPIKNLTAVANQISQGDLTKRADTNLSNEIGQLAVAFNNMTDKLQGYTNLEDQIEKRTKELEIEKNNLEKVVKDRTLELKNLNLNLEKEVEQRTKDLQKKLRELDVINKATVGRELKMIQLKKQLGKTTKTK